MQPLQGGPLFVMRSVFFGKLRDVTCGAIKELLGSLKNSIGKLHDATCGVIKELVWMWGH
jgi:hypothetical protein